MSNVKLVIKLFIVSMLSFGSLLVFAHHSARGFDANRHIDLEGRVIELDYRNPHIEMMIHVGVDDPTTNELEGQVWEVETVSATTAHRHGIYADSLAIGDPLRVRGWAAKDGGLEIFVSSITLFEEPEKVLLVWEESFEAGSLVSDSVSVEKIIDNQVLDDTEESNETEKMALTTYKIDSSVLLKVKTYVLRDRLN